MRLGHAGLDAREVHGRRQRAGVGLRVAAAGAGSGAMAPGDEGQKRFDQVIFDFFLQIFIYLQRLTLHIIARSVIYE
jgi:hypothetical protein